MGRKPLVAIPEARLSPAELADARERVMDASVSEGTRRMYRARIRIMEDFVRGATGEVGPMSEDLWFAFVAAFMDAGFAKGSSSLEGYRSAVGFAQQSHVWPGSWATAKSVKMSCRVVQFQGRKRQRGASTRISCRRCWSGSGDRITLLQCLNSWW